MVIYGHLSHSYGTVYETTNQSLLVTAGMPCSLKRMVMSSTEFSYAAAASEKCFKGGQHQKCIPTVHTHTHIYITHVHYTSLYTHTYIYIHCSSFFPSLSIYNYIYIWCSSIHPTAKYWKGIGQRQMWHGLNAILATESHIHLLAITLGQAIAQPRSGSGRESWNALKTAVLRWCLGTKRCT
jgi:hypothetical protein